MYGESVHSIIPRVSYARVCQDMIMPEALFEKLYQAEWDRRDAIQGDTSVPLGILALLGSGLVVLVKEYEEGGGAVDVLFWAGFGISVASFLIAIYMLVRSFHGYTYYRLPFPSELKEYRDGARVHHRAAGTPLLADRAFDDFLEQRLIEATDRNMENNTNRGAYLEKTNTAIIVTLVALAVTSVPYSVRERTIAPRPQKVEITHIPGVAMQQSISPSPRPATPTVPPMPIPPSNVPEKTGVRAPKPK